ncbi:S9 family peptidase [Balneolaceae bacterium ANBcel3]|nr:S9 family peptidase [Balneolaceae bacterium ANBcel3]
MKSKAILFLSGIVVSFLFISIESVQAQLYAEDVVNLRQAGNVEINERGSHIAYTLFIPRSEEDPVGPGYTELRVLTVDNGKDTVVVDTSNRVSSVSWIPGTDRVAFLMRSEEHHDKTQVYSLDYSGGDLTRHTDAPEGVRAYAFSRDASHIAYTMTDAVSPEVEERQERGFDMIVSGENERFTRLWIQKGEESRVVTPEDMMVWDFAWAPDNHQLAVRMTYGTGIDDEMMFSEIMRLRLDDNSLDLLAESQGKVGPMRWSPDGNRFAFLAAKAINDPLPQRLYVTRTGAYTAEDITPEGYEGTPEWIEWYDNETLRFVAVEGTVTRLREIPAAGGEAVPLGGGEREIFRSVSFDASGSFFAAAVHRRDHPAEVYTGTLPGPRWNRITNHNPWLRDIVLGRQETIEWFGPDGTVIEGVLTYPVDYDEEKAYPLAILPHGGPEGVSLDGWNTRALYPAQVFASHGFAVLKPNYRGSGGRGSWFTMANHRDLGGKEFEDVIHGIDYLAHQGLVDPGRVGMSGTSYGGYFSAWAATRHTNRFAAAATFAGLSNWISFMGTTDIPNEMSITHWDLWWFENPGLVWERSPVARLEYAKTPLLVAHGLADERVHPEQSIQLYQFLRLNDIPSELVLYPRQPHGLIERAHQLDFMNRVVDWFIEHTETSIFVR